MSASDAVLILGGSFNPPHRAHFALAHAALDALGIDQCQLIPSGQPWQKPHVAPTEHRLAMLELAVQDDSIRHCTDNLKPYPICINPIEVLANEASYTVNTLTQLHAQAHLKDSTLVWLIGSDQLSNLHTWHNWQGILDLAHLAVVQRAGYEVNPEQISDAAVREHYLARRCTTQSELWRRHAHGYFIEVQVAGMPVSSTQIRAQIAQHQPTPDICPQVKNYIQTHNLYSS